jgi:hypothetical protein
VRFSRFVAGSPFPSSSGSSASAASLALSPAGFRGDATLPAPPDAADVAEVDFVFVVVVLFGKAPDDDTAVETASRFFPPAVLVAVVGFLSSGAEAGVVVLPEPVAASPGADAAAVIMATSFWAGTAVVVAPTMATE